MQDASNTTLNHLFTQRLLVKLLNHSNSSEYCSIIKRYAKDFEDKTNGQLISEIYSFMSKSYRNEYFYQNTLLNKLLLGKHSVKTTTALSQIPIANSKADFVLINGKAVVYEIKTELDSLDRLETQLSDYYSAFDHVCVVTAEQNFERVCSAVKEQSTGVYALTSRNTISNTLKREPTRCSDFLSHESLFKVLRKNEYENILTDYFEKLPCTTPVFYYGECFKLFQLIPIKDAYFHFLHELKKRNSIEVSTMQSIPYELKSVFYFSHQCRRKVDALQVFWNSTFGG